MRYHCQLTVEKQTDTDTETEYILSQKWKNQISYLSHICNIW